MRILLTAGSVLVVTLTVRACEPNVYSTWQGNSLRVALGTEAEEFFKDIVVPTQLLKEADAEQENA